MLMMVQATLPMAANAQTNPPQGSGDWTIPQGDVTYYNNSQTLVQGDIHVYGTLIVHNSNVFLWGANNGDRNVYIYSGGELYFNNSVLSSYTSACIDVFSYTGSVISSDGSRFDTICNLEVNSKDVYFNDTTFEKTRLEIDIDETYSSFDGTTGTTEYYVEHIYSNLTFANTSATQNTLLWIEDPSSELEKTLLFSNLEMSVSGINEFAIRDECAYDCEYVEFNGLDVYGTYTAVNTAYLTIAYPLLYFSYSYESKILRNFTIHDAPNHMAISNPNGNENSGVVILDNGTIYNLGLSSNYASSIYPFDMDNGHNVDLIHIDYTPVIISNLNISNNIHGSYTASSTSDPKLRQHKTCTAINFKEVKSVEIDNLTIKNNCKYSYYNPYSQVSSYYGNYCPNLDYQYNSNPYEKMRSYSSYCNHWTFSAIKNEHDWGNSNNWGSSTEPKFIMRNSTIEDNNELIHMYNSSSTSNWQYRHVILLSAGVISQSSIEISNSTVQNNTNAKLTKSTTYSNQAQYSSHVHNYELLLIAASNSYSYINNSLVNLPQCYSQSVGTANNARDQCKAVFFDDGTINFVNTSVVSADFLIEGGEAVVYYNLDVRVTDPDAQWTPNATVEVIENGFWNLGSKSTGPDGGLVSFIAKYFSQTTSSNYVYTPHQITVTMPGYSNSTTVNVTNYTSVIVYDPTPDAFPGDITQDFDTDGDGYGDNISGNNPDYFPNDATQWSDVDGDGYGDNMSGNNPDMLPNDPTQWNDTDGDGFGDNQSGNNPDQLPNDPTQWDDYDGDGYGDNQFGNNWDMFRNDPTQWQDFDGDGYGDNQSGNNPDRFPYDNTQWNDTDGDGYGDNMSGNNPDLFPLDPTQYYDGDGDGLGDNQSGNNPDPFLGDSDNDGYPNSIDTFPWNPTQHEDLDGDGLGDNTSGTAADPYPNDTDNDGSNNSVDPFPLDPTQWLDEDQDGYGDNQSGNNPDPYIDDSDNDGVNNTNDAFPYNPTQTTDSDGDGYGDDPNGYPADMFPNEPSQWQDSDGDGYGDNSNGVNGDKFPNNPSQWNDTDGDGYGDNPVGFPADMYPNDPTQWADSDGDGYGDNSSGNNGDAFPTYPNQWNDTDGDGWGDNPTGYPADLYPSDPTQWTDSDGDGYGDNSSGTNGDQFPNDPTQWLDTDGDGYGDNQTGTMGDMFPNDGNQWVDSDGDGYGDNYYTTIDSVTGLRIQYGDAFPLDASQWSDIDGDGYGDNATGTLPDEYPYDPTQWIDTDGDGFPDNYFYQTNVTTGLRDSQTGDAFPYDATQWSDIDGDGYGDNQTGNNPDIFPTDPTQWADADGDGLGDNPSGNNPDPTPGDSDNDGVADYLDAFPNEPTQWSDSDGDGYGDNWGVTEWTSLRPNSWPGMFILGAVKVDYFPLTAAAANDTDFDGFPDDWTLYDQGNNRDGLVADHCPLIFGNATSAGPGCPDSDGDNVADQNDAFPNDPTQWSDSDGDGYGDNPSGSFPDMFPNDPSQCCDVDGDGYGDNSSSEPYDHFPINPTQWHDSDGDGYGDNQAGSNPDRFPQDVTQWRDFDNDGLGDNQSGNNPDPFLDDTDNDGYPNDQDDCYLDAGNSSYDLVGCPDADGDGVSDNNDLWPNDPSRSLDSDLDQVNDPDDAFPNDPTQWTDNDGDGFGDNPNGNNPDPSLDDFDNDGYITQEDAFPLDPTQWVDLDGDGFGDNSEGDNPDPYPNDTDNDGVQNPQDLYPLDETQQTDSDGDGWGDNPFGNDGDQYPNDPTQCCDTDGDGWGDNPNGTMPDAFPLDPTQWMDLDGDGLGDNAFGSNPDPWTNDTDNDGVKNNVDSWPLDPTKSLDTDGDGIEDGDENFLTANIAKTSASTVITIVLVVAIFTGVIGYLLGQRRPQKNNFPLPPLPKVDAKKELSDDEL